MGKGKDKVQRKRRPNTDQEKVAKKKKKEEEGRRKENKDSVNGFRALFHRKAAPAPPDPHPRESDVATAQEEKEDDEVDRSEEICVPLPTNGTVDGGVVIADLDDDSVKEDDAFTDGPMGAYIKAVLLRL
eukprot:CAMPEP_0198142146 /NCGR_PEP_ID=MMETSP1443-20131203/5029_1 /TAXON_ID=186043 /ORGANISM="Entomoneis sp., Strain CCMP2396" /LENGTH=129 /DNA_ID=CAMNT_0043805103 /DNA_START=74 /DNA_END=461 /DNA_ORIENTATION=-